MLPICSNSLPAFSVRIAIADSFVVSTPCGEWRSCVVLSGVLRFFHTSSISCALFHDRPASYAIRFVGGGVTVVLIVLASAFVSSQPISLGPEVLYVFSAPCSYSFTTHDCGAACVLVSVFCDM